MRTLLATLLCLFLVSGALRPLHTFAAEPKDISQRKSNIVFLGENLGLKLIDSKRGQYWHSTITGMGQVEWIFDYQYWKSASVFAVIRVDWSNVDFAGFPLSKQKPLKRTFPWKKVIDKGINFSNERPVQGTEFHRITSLTFTYQGQSCVGFRGYANEAEHNFFRFLLFGMMCSHGSEFASKYEIDAALALVGLRDEVEPKASVIPTTKASPTTPTPLRKKKPAPSSAPNKLTQSAEVVFWQSISSSTDADDFIAYLKRFPNGVFAPLARNKLKRMGIVLRDTK